MLGAVLALAAGAAWAEGPDVAPPRGLWESPPDARGLVYHVRTKACGRALCGRIERVKDRRGVDAPSNAVSHRILDGLRPVAGGAFLGDLHWPGSDPVADVRVTPEGSALKVESCGDAGCAAARWKRLR